MKIIKWILPAIAASLLAACATSQNYAMTVKSWLGASTKTLFARWGYPDRKMKLQNGNTLYIYHNEEKGETPPTMFPGYTTVKTRNGTTEVSATPPIFTGGTRYDLRCDTWFEINKASRVVGASFRGNDCVAGTEFRDQYSNLKVKPKKK